MALENVPFLQYPFGYDFNDCYTMEKLSCETLNNIYEQTASNGCYWDYSPLPRNSSPEYCAAGSGFLPVEYSPAVVPAKAASGTRKRRRTKFPKNKEEVENQRMTHIAVERNRRRQVNDYLAVLRSLLPPSYGQRGDQASIVGGTINFVKELEQLLQFLEVRNQVKNQLSSNYDHNNNNSHYHPFSKFFTSPQYSTPKTRTQNPLTATMPHKSSTVADVEVAMVKSHANVKVLSRKQPKQLVKMLKWFNVMSLTILHLNVTTIDHMVLYSFSLKVEADCQMMSADEIATAVHEMVALIQEDTI